MDVVIRTEDGTTFKEGDRAYNYYDMKPGVIRPNSITMAPDAWFDFDHDDGTRALLNGQRICSLAHAKRMGWPNAE